MSVSDAEEYIETSRICGVSDGIATLAEGDPEKEKNYEDWICPDPDCDSHKRRNFSKTSQKLQGK